jgi:hypothetical protein
MFDGLLKDKNKAIFSSRNSCLDVEMNDFGKNLTFYPL